MLQFKRCCSIGYEASISVSSHDILKYISKRPRIDLLKGVACTYTYTPVYTPAHMDTLPNAKMQILVLYKTLALSRKMLFVEQERAILSGGLSNLTELGKHSGTV